MCVLTLKVKGVWEAKGVSSACPHFLPQASPPPRASQPCARVQTGRWAASTAVSTKCASTTNCRISRPSHLSPLGSLPAASPALCVDMACVALWRRTMSCVSATQDGPVRCVIRKRVTPALVTGECYKSTRFSIHKLPCPRGRTEH